MGSAARAQDRPAGGGVRSGVEARGGRDAHRSREIPTARFQRQHGDAQVGERVRPRLRGEPFLGARHPGQLDPCRRGIRAARALPRFARSRDHRFRVASFDEERFSEVEQLADLGSGIAERCGDERCREARSFHSGTAVRDRCVSARRGCRSIGIAGEHQSPDERPRAGAGVFVPRRTGLEKRLPRARRQRARAEMHEPAAHARREDRRRRLAPETTSASSAATRQAPRALQACDERRRSPASSPARVRALRSCRTRRARRATRPGRRFARVNRSAARTRGRRTRPPTRLRCGRTSAPAPACESRDDRWSAPSERAALRGDRRRES